MLFLLLALDVPDHSWDIEVLAGCILDSESLSLLTEGSLECRLLRRRRLQHLSRFGGACAAVRQKQTVVRRLLFVR